jgi:hypothetical protein
MNSIEVVMQFTDYVLVNKRCYIDVYKRSTDRTVRVIQYVVTVATVRERDEENTIINLPYQFPRTRSIHLTAAASFF